MARYEWHGQWFNTFEEWELAYEQDSCPPAKAGGGEARKKLKRYIFRDKCFDFFTMACLILDRQGSV